jgi:pyruvate dehydrogenase E1 component alpha subunit
MRKFNGITFRMLRRVLSAPVRSLNRFASSASFDFNPCILHDIAADAGPPTSGNVTAEEAVKYYTQMQTIRRMELKADQLYKQKGAN